MSFVTFVSERAQARTHARAAHKTNDGQRSRAHTHARTNAKAAHTARARLGVRRESRAAALFSLHGKLRSARTQQYREYYRSTVNSLSREMRVNIYPTIDEQIAKRRGRRARGHALIGRTNEHPQSERTHERSKKCYYSRSVSSESMQCECRQLAIIGETALQRLGRAPHMGHLVRDTDPR